MKLLLENWRQYLAEEDENSELVKFIVRSNEIEGYQVDPEEVRSAIEGQLEGYPLTYVTQNPHIYSHLSGLETAKGGYRSVDDITGIHKAMGPDALEAGAPGVLRSGVEAESAEGREYVASEDVAEALSWWSEQTWDDPFESHAVYEMIHPFGDGNGRSGRIILAAMLDFDFPRINSMIGEDYFSKLESFNPKYEGNFWDNEGEQNETPI
tara:strand:+ start:340 stop:969 length:630 start_codon:yes stop_codon:yes gene_type:complete